MSDSQNVGWRWGALTARELKRKVVHMAVGGIAFAVAFLGPFYSALCALAAVMMNLFVLPRMGGKALWREHEETRGMSLGIVLYPFAVFLLILVFWRRLDVAAAVWGILAFGDGMASVVGMAIGGRKLPWNSRKSWAGTLAYWFFGTIGASALLLWTVHHRGGEIDPTFAIGAAALATLFAAFIESQPQGIDDNISVPLLTGLVLLGILESVGFGERIDVDAFVVTALVGAAINLVLSLVAWRARSVSVSGAIAGWLVGTAIYAFLDWRGYLLLLTFFVLGTAATKLGYARKAAENLAQEGGGRRGARHAVANTGVPALLAVFAATTPHEALLLPAFAAAFATAAGDTLSSEIGQLWGRRTFLITTLKPVPRGTEGAVSLEGTLAGLAGSAGLATLGWAVGFYPLMTIALVTLAAFIGTTLESLVGATLEKRGLLDNEAVNFLNTLVGALVAALLVAAVGVA